MTVSNLSRQNIFVDTNLENLKTFTRNNTIGVEPRTDYGFIVYSVETPVAGTIFRDNSAMKKVPLFAVCAYTEAGESDPVPGMYQDGTKIRPIIHISSIVSSIDHENILPMATTFAVSWLTRIYNDPNNIKPVLTAILRDPATGNKWEPASTNEIIEQANRVLQAPVIVCDCVEGRSKIPGLTDMLIDRGHSLFSSFFNIDPVS